MENMINLMGLKEINRFSLMCHNNPLFGGGVSLKTFLTYTDYNNV
jgi:hypothetical protein